MSPVCSHPSGSTVSAVFSGILRYPTVPILIRLARLIVPAHVHSVMP
ncbi:Uncharacterised protein [Mycobacteroides abscessus subsp. abscessus]|nr:Uncharacterised protein [Mycobacteroides abscessus subsp. abscessus]